MQKHTVTRTTTETDAMFDTSPAAMTRRLSVILDRQLHAGLHTAAAHTADLIAIHARRAAAILTEVKH